MIHAELNDVWLRALAIVARQSPPAQIFTWLFVAFVVLMFVEGLRASFLPRRLVEQVRRRGASALEAATPQARASGASMTVFEARRAKLAALPVTRNAKLPGAAPVRRPATRPTIRRVSSYFEMPGEPEQSFSPLAHFAADTPASEVAIH